MTPRVLFSFSGAPINEGEGDKVTPQTHGPPKEKKKLKKVPAALLISAISKSIQLALLEASITSVCSLELEL